MIIEIIFYQFVPVFLRSERAPTEKMARANTFWAFCAARKAQAPHFLARHFSSSNARSRRFSAPGAWSFWRPRARGAPTKRQFFETQAGILYKILSYTVYIFIRRK